MGKILNLFGVKSKREQRFEVAEKVIVGLRNNLDNIRMLFKSTQNKAEISSELMVEVAEYDGNIIKVQRMLLAILQKNFAKTPEELVILENWLFNPLLEAKIGNSYNLNEKSYNLKIERLNTVIKRLRDLENGHLPQKVQEIEETYSKAA